MVTEEKQTEPMRAIAKALKPALVPAARAMSSTAPSSTWSKNQTQEEFMKNDMVICLNDKDEVTGGADKYVTHQWVTPGTDNPPPLHRAFSVFLYNSDNKLLLQQRASSKITFPDVWTNSCCSHPLHFEAELEAKDQMGVKRAAVRKLDHELGIKPGSIDPTAFKFLTRVHYSAPYIPGYGPPPANDDVEGWKKVEWGEHEIDYVLFVKADVELDPHPEEVRDTCWVSKDELYAMMKKPGLHWSPWFCKIVEKWYDGWTEDIDATINTDKHVDLDTIHKL